MHFCFCINIKFTSLTLIIPGLTHVYQLQPTNHADAIKSFFTQLVVKLNLKLLPTIFLMLNSCVIVITHKLGICQISNTRFISYVLTSYNWLQAV